MASRRVDLSDAEAKCGDSALGRVRRAYDGLRPGESLEVVTEVAEQVFAVRAWSRRAGGEVVEEVSAPGQTRLVVRRPAA